MKGTYYNEFDPFAAAWLRELIKENLIAPGDVDERSIKDVKADDIKNYAQCHFFAGIGGWSLALRLAGVPDDFPAWTGSCPCQPLSVAGKRKGHADERHLWPAFHALIAECRPATVFGEQVAGKDGREWLAALRADMEETGYAVGAADLCAAGVGAPHIRQRLYWLAESMHTKWREVDVHRQDGCDGENNRREKAYSIVGTCGEIRRLANAHSEDSSGRRIQRPGEGAGAGVGATRERLEGLREDSRPGPTNGLWRDVDWLGCRDGKWRPVEPGTFPLADGRTFRNRVAELRGAGNAIVPALAAEFIAAFFEINS